MTRPQRCRQWGATICRVSVDCSKRPRMTRVVPGHGEHVLRLKMDLPKEEKKLDETEAYLFTPNEPESEMDGRRYTLHDEGTTLRWQGKDRRCAEEGEREGEEGCRLEGEEEAEQVHEQARGLPQHQHRTTHHRTNDTSAALSTVGATICRVSVDCSKRERDFAEPIKCASAQPSIDSLLNLTTAIHSTDCLDILIVGCGLRPIAWRALRVCV